MFLKPRLYGVFATTVYAVRRMISSSVANATPSPLGKACHAISFKLKFEHTDKHQFTFQILICRWV